MIHQERIKEDVDFRFYVSQLPSSIANAIPVDAILARQGTATTREGAKLSQFGTALFDEYCVMFPEDHAPINQWDAELSEARLKVRRTKWQPQGQPADKGKLDTNLENGYAAPRVVASKLIRKLINRPVAKNMLKKILEPIAQQIEANGVTIQSDSAVYTRMKQKDKSNTGVLFFSTDKSRDHQVIVLAIKLIDHLIENQDLPMIEWYRHMNGKMRNIFAASIVHACMYEKYLSWLFTEAFKTSPNVYYCSEMEQSRRIEEFKRKNAKYTIVVIEGDYESMDMGQSEELAHLCVSIVLETLCEMGCGPVVDLTEAEVHRILAALSVFFNQPVLDFDGTVKFRDWNTLSGVGITNGSEDYVNLVMQIAALAMTLDASVVDYYFTVMGDDSALFLALKKEADVEAFVRRFVDNFVFVSSESGLVINKDKQDWSRRKAHFCKRYYPLLPIKGVTYANGLPVPAYLLEYSVKSCKWPEDGPLNKTKITVSWEGGNPIPATEIGRILSVIDNAVGDPRFAAFVTQIASKRKLRPVWTEYLRMLDAGELDGLKTPKNWREKVWGAPQWSPKQSPTLLLIRKVLNR